MKRLLRLLLSFLLVSFIAAPLRAGDQAQLGDVARLFDFYAAKVVADPVRDRVYALLPETNSVAVIDTTTLTVTATVVVGSHPQDLSITPDGGTLYTANPASATGTVGVLDLATLQTRPALSLSAPAYEVAAGLNNRLYVLTGSTGGNAINQLNANTGAVQNTLATNVYAADLGISPDGRTLFITSDDDFAAGMTVANYDVSTGTPRRLTSAVVGTGSIDYSPLSFSHDSQTFFLPHDEGNTNGGTALYSATTLTSRGAFANTNVPGPAAFSADDTVAYQIEFAKPDVLRAFSTATFAPLDSVPLPSFDGPGNTTDVAQLVTDRTGSLLFLAKLDYSVASNNRLTVLATGTGPLSPTNLLPVLTAEPHGISATFGVSFTYQINASHHPTAYTAANLPPGLTLDPSKGIISGTPGGPVSPPVGTNYLATLTATNSVGTATATLLFTVVEDPTPPVITSALNVQVVAGAPVKYFLTATNAPDDYDVDTALPPGLSFNFLTAAISGTPTIPGTYPVTIELANYYGRTTGTITFVVAPAGTPAPVITSSLALAERPGYLFSYQITAANNPIRYAVTGLDNVRFDAATGLLSVLIQNAGVYPVTLQASNAGGTDIETLVITVAQPDHPVPIFLYTELAASGQVGQDFGESVQASDDTTRFGAVGLPPGLSIDPDTGYVTGQPTQAGVFNVTLQATNANGTGTLLQTITILPDVPYVDLYVSTPGYADVVSGAPAVLLLQLNRPATSDLFVNYTVKGSAVNGTDYQLLKGRKKIKAGNKRAYLRIKPLGNLGGYAKRTVKISLVADDRYILGGISRDAKIKLLVLPP